MKNLILLVLVALLSTGCEPKCGIDLEPLQMLPRDGTPIKIYLDPGLKVARSTFEIGARLWDTVGVNFQISDEVQDQGSWEARNTFVVKDLDLTVWGTGYAGLTSTAHSVGNYQVTMYLLASSDWHVVAHELGHSLDLQHVESKYCRIMTDHTCSGVYELGDEDLTEFVASEDRVNRRQYEYIADVAPACKAEATRRIHDL